MDELNPKWLNQGILAVEKEDLIAAMAAAGFNVDGINLEMEA
jgi:hypothetical protein